jgi:DNA-binding transcriptional MerR regulator/mannose-6-phosphate isomerase-like protein (cupin superfamily)
VRKLDGQAVFTITEVADAVGVSQQTLRVWEAKKLLNPARSPGGHRLYSDRAVERAKRIADLRREMGWNPAAIATALAGKPDDSSANGMPRHGASLRKARRERGLTLRELAERVDVSASALSALERGEARVSSALVARLADALLIPMGALASSTPPSEAVIREPMRPRTVNKGGVIWEELGSIGGAMEPALLTVPPGEDSGGSYSRAGETFAFLLEGGLDFSLSSAEPREFDLSAGDAITIPARTIFSWCNPDARTARVLWVESLISPDRPPERPKWVPKGAG